MDNATVERHRKRHLSEGDETLGQQDARRVRSLVEVELDPRIGPAVGQQQEQEPAIAVVRPFISESTSRIHRPPSPPESDCNSQDSDSDEEDDEDQVEDAALAGYEYCSKEAIRYLMEEEKLDADHPVIRQLQQHLDSRRAHVSMNPGPSSNQ